MKKWVLKALIQKLIAALPGSHSINFWFQKNITRGVRLTDQYLDDKLQHAADHLRFARKYRLPRERFCLELGTGWYPIVPVCMYLAGAKTAVTIDLSPLLTEAGIRETVERLQARFKEGPGESFAAYFRRERLEAFLALEPKQMSGDALLEAMAIEYRNGDAQGLDEPSDHFHLIHSNNVFEHVQPKVLEGILREFERVMRPGGLGSHFIDMSDHFAHLDQSISIYNFLRFSEKQWSWIDNSVQPQNRWRLSDYLKLYDRLGFRLLAEETRPGEPEKLATLKLAAPFNRYDLTDVAVSHCHLVNQK